MPRFVRMPGPENAVTLRRGPRAPRKPKKQDARSLPRRPLLLRLHPRDDAVQLLRPRQLLGVDVVAAQYNVMSLRALHRSANPFLVSRPLVAALESLLRLFGVVLVGAGVQNFVPIG